jgi:CHAT domain-containing protein
MSRFLPVLLFVFLALGVTNAYSQTDTTDLRLVFKSFYKKKDYSNAIKAGVAWKASMQLNGIAKSDSAIVARTLMDLASCYGVTLQHNKSEMTLAEALKIMPPDSADYSSMLSGYGNIKSKLGKYAEADSILNVALRAYKHYHLENTISFIACLANFAELQFDRGFVAEAQQRYLQAMRQWNENNFGEKPQIGRIYNGLYQVEDAFGNLDQAEYWLEKAIAVLSKFYPLDGELILGRKKLYAKLLMDKGQLDKAEPYLLELMQLQAEKRGKNTMEYARSMAVLTCIDQKLGKFEEGLELTELQHPIYLANIGPAAYETLENQYNRVALLRDANRLEEAKVVIQNIQDSLARHANLDPKNSARLSVLLAACEPLPANSIPFRKKALELYLKAASGNILGAPSESAILLARDYLLIGQLDSAEQVLNLFKDVAGLESGIKSNYLRMLFFRGYMNQLKGNSQPALADWSKVVALHQAALSRDLFLLNDDERLNRLNRLKYVVDMLLTQCRNKDMQEAGISALALDFHLFTKSLLLSTAHKIRTNLLADSSMASTFSAWIDARYRLAWCYSKTEKTLSAQKIDIKGIETLADSLEQVISRRSAAFVSADLGKPYHWTNVRDNLAPGEAAIEIARYNIFETDTISYVLFIVRHGGKAPIAVTIPNGQQLDQILLEQYLTECAAPGGKGRTLPLYDAFWKKIEPYLVDISRVYIAADGAFFKINAGAIQLPNGNYVADKFDLRTVFSLKEIRHEASEQVVQGTAIPRTAFLAGNPAFLQTTGEKEAASTLRGLTETTGSNTSQPSLGNMIQQAEETRGLTLSPLPGTEKEVLDITALLQQKGWLATVVIGNDATEDTIKSIKSPWLLHLATHGYFLSNVRSGTAGLSKSVLERNPMLRSMVFFAGAQNTLDKAPAGREDGILTAYEAQNLQLEGTELVVLSACQTAQGKIQNGEGVYGLQRALRIAGAKSVLMSLWDVDDKVGREFMTQFYTHWLNGATKAEAFRKAQLETKKKHPQPFYWAGFILIE